MWCAPMLGCLVLAPNGVVNQTLLGLGLIEAPLVLSFNTGADRGRLRPLLLPCCRR